MTVRATIAHARRTIAFARHIPIERLARRCELRIGRMLERNLGRHAPPSTEHVCTSTSPPSPVFAARHGHLEIADDETRFRFLGRTVAMRDEIDWRAPGPRREDRLWQMHLHYMEYLEESDDGLFERLLTQWIAGNPLGDRTTGGDAWHSYALSIRCVVWMQQLAARGARIAGHVRAAAVGSLIAQLSYLERRLETDLGGNHLVKNIKALIWASAFFEGPAAARWRELGIRHLARALARQVLPDGTHSERSPSYHCQVFADLLECRHALGRDPFGGALEAALTRMAQATADLTHPDGLVAQFNDAGLGMAYKPAACLAVHSALLGTAPRPHRVFAFADAGYFGLRSGGAYVLLDCGALAPDDLIAHAHGDVLSFECSVGGLRMIVDQGVFEYPAGSRRQAARSSRSHNTLTIDGADQADFYGDFRCGRRPRVEVLAYEPTPDGFMLEGTHDGFAPLVGSPRHVRRFTATPDEIVIVDRIEGGGAHRGTVGFLLHPDCTVAVLGTDARIERDGASIDLAASEPLTVADAVWWPDLGVELKTRRLQVRLAPGTRTARFVLKLSGRAPARAAPEARS